jgi:hypoxanthine phosphoribosyltransferase
MSGAPKIALAFEVVSRRLRSFPFPAVDAVVGIRRGGTVPACLVAHQLGLPVFFVALAFRDDDNRPCHPAPLPVEPAPDIPASLRRLLLVDEVSVTGSTLAAAARMLPAPGRTIVTFVLKGRGPADLVLFPEIEPCVFWPWKHGGA